MMDSQPVRNVESLQFLLESSTQERITTLQFFSELNQFFLELIKKE